MGLLDGTPDAHFLGHVGTATLTPELWTNDKGRMLLDYIRRDIGIFFDWTPSSLIYRDEDEAGSGSVSGALNQLMLKTATREDYETHINVARCCHHQYQYQCNP
jgi:hypothetical protein